MKALLAARDPQVKAARVEARRAKAGEARRNAPPMNEERPTRYIPAPVKRAVLLRDGGRCVFRGTDGRVCGSTHGIEIDHVTPFALGGRSDDPDQLRCLCRTHNRWRAEKTFGAFRLTATGGGETRRPAG